MATKRRKTRKRSKGLHAGALMARGKRTRRRSRKRGLSEAFSPATATASAKNMLSGAIGGFGYGLLKPAIDGATDNALVQNGLPLAASFLASAVLKMDGVASGIAGAWGYDMSRKISGMAEMNDYVDGNVLDEPEYMDESGNPMFLADDGNFYYLDEMNEDEMMDEDGMSAAPVFLADGSFYPEYVNVSNY